MSRIKLVISGGQDGVDFGALQAAQYMNIATGGYMPKNYATEKGTNSRRAQQYNLQESHGSYKERDIQNVDMADGVVAFLLNREKTGRGTTSTVRYAEMGEHKFEPLTKPTDCDYLELSGPNVKKPCLVIWMPELKTDGYASDKMADRKAKIRHFPKIICDFLFKHKIEKLMLSGFCESTFDTASDTTRELMTNVFLYLAALHKRSTPKDEPEKVNTD